MSSLDLKEREEQAAGNADDSLNPGNRHYSEDLINQKKNASDEEINDDFDGILAANGIGASDEKTDAHGDKVKRNYNAGDDRENVQDQENNPDSLYKQGAQESGAKAGISSWFARKGKKYGASGGILGILGVGMIVISAMLSPAALFATIEKSLTNDGSDFSRTNSTVWRAYRGTLFNGDCSGSKLKCKFVTATKKQLTKWVENRFKVTGTIVDSDGKATSGGERELKPDDVKEGERVRMTSLEFPNGVKVKNNAEFENETRRSLDSRRSGLRVIHDKAGSFFTEKFKKGVLGKWGLAKGTIAKKNSRPAESEEDKKRQIDEARNTANGKVSGTLDKIGKGMGLATGPVTVGCTVYNTLRIIVGIVKAKWIADVVKFAFPFVQIASKLADGSATDADFAEITGRADQLVWYQNDGYTEKLAEKETDPEKKQKILDKKNLAGTDSQGLRMAMYGDTTDLLEFTKDYTTGGIGSIKALGNGIKEFQETMGGKENIRTICINAQRGQTAEGILSGIACAVAAIATGGLAAVGCVVKAVAATVAGNLIQDAAMDYIVQELTKRLMSADIPSNLRGVDAGNALAAGMGMMLAQTSLGHGMQPAKSTAEVKDFITMTNDTYYQDYTEIAKDDAAKDPFNLYNQYSFASVINTSLNPYISGQKTGFAFLANTMTVIKNSLIPSASALHSQPSLMTNDDANLNHRLNVMNGQPQCSDTDKQDIGFVCDWSGRIVGVTSPRILNWARQMAAGDTTPLSDTLEYMQATGKYQDIGKKKEEDGGTKDDTCGNVNDIFTVGNCDDSEQPSIKEDGTVNEGSQYALYKKYCSETRELDMGSSEETLETGTDKDQDWMTGKQCSNPKNSEMMDRFAFYFNLCETQYAMANDATDCTNDNIQEAASVTPSECAANGDPKSIYTCALKYDNYRYSWGGGHGGNAQEWIAKFKSGAIPEWEPILDCSGLVRMAFVEAMGIEDQAYVAPDGYNASKFWEKVPLEQAQQGDIVTSSGHVAIVEANDPAAKTFKIFHASTKDGVKEDNIKHGSQSYDRTIAAFRARKVTSV